MYIGKRGSLHERKLINSIILASSPEKQGELEGLWEKYSPQFNLRDDNSGFSLSVIFGTVVFDHKSLCNMWLLGFAAQKAFSAYSPLIILSNLMNIKISHDSLPGDAEQTAQLADFKLIIDKILELKKLSNIDDFSWPEDVPKPYDGKPLDVNGAMAFDLICMSGAYCFLHEVQHLRFDSDGRGIDVYEEELQCDKFARDTLLSEVSKYSAESGYNENVVYAKRAMSIALASFLLFAITPKENWGKTETHSKIKDRINKLAKSVDIDGNSYFWIYFGSLTMSIAYYNEIEVIPFSSLEF